MIKSITFPNDSEVGYIYRKIKEPEKPTKSDREYQQFRIYEKWNKTPNGLHHWDFENFTLNDEGKLLLKKDLDAYKKAKEYYKCNFLI